MEAENLTIGAFARAAGVHVETVRFYQRKGLLPQPDKPYGSIRRYGEADVARARFVKTAQRLGFSLEEIAENGYNLNIPRYVDTFEPEEEIDVATVQKDIVRIEAELAEVRAKMAGYLKELGVDV